MEPAPVGTDSVAAVAADVAPGVATDEGTGRGVDDGLDGVADLATSQDVEPVCQPIANCNDGNKCTVDFCRTDGTCDHAPVYCGNSNPCTVDGCDPDTGCTFKPADCDDGDICTQDLCNYSVGCYWQAQGCDDGNPCTADTCANNKCTSVPKADGLLCLSQGGECKGLTCTKPVCGGTGWKGWMTQLPENAKWGGGIALAFADGSLAVAFRGYPPKQVPARVQWFSASGEPASQTVLVPGPNITTAVALADGSVAIAGSQQSDKGMTAGVVGRVTAAGEVSLVSPPGWAWGQQLATGPKGAWVHSQYKPSQNQQVAIAVARLDNTAKPESETVLAKSAVGNSVSANALAGAHDGGAWVVATEYEYAKNAYLSRLHRLDVKAMLVWIADLGGANAFALVPRADGAVVLVAANPGASASAFGTRIRVVSASGVVGDWIVLPLVGNPQSMTLGQDGGYWLRGGELAKAAGPGKGQPWLARLDGNDKVLFKTTVASAESLLVDSLAQLPNGHLVAVWGADVAPEDKLQPAKTMWLATTDPWGHLTCTAAGKCAGLTICADGDPCTADACAPATGCTFTPLPVGATCTQP